MISTLYLCYFGLREPLVQTQVLPYLRELAAGGVCVSLLTFEPELKRSWTRAQVDDEEARLAREGIRWLRLAYHKRPTLPATAFDIVAGALKAARVARRDGVQVLHARSHVPMAMALIARTLARVRTVFDVRGLLAEEYEDAGLWRARSLPFRAVKWLERAGLRRASRVVVLTRRMREWLDAEGLVEAARVEVIPCCVDFARYDAAGDVRKSERFEVVYAGSVKGLYMLEEMARFFLAVRALRPDAFFRVLTTSSAEATADVLRRAGLRDEDFGVGGVGADEVPRVLRRARLGVSFRRATFSQIAASPTKIPEYLAAGLAVVSNAGIGDTDELLERERVGVLVSEFTEEDYARAAREALRLCETDATSARAVETARKFFDLETIGGRRYLDVYRQLEEMSVATQAASERVG
jgi:glycosyltransferase involved in cell wall biosynthesis